MKFNESIKTFIYRAKIVKNLHSETKKPARDHPAGFFKTLHAHEKCAEAV
jgi:hypothetical protein